MTERKDGGQAFPSEFFETEHGDRVEAFAGSPGMSLRDWFAGQALAALATFEDLEFADLSSMAYRLADAMIAEGSK